MHKYIHTYTHTYTLIQCNYNIHHKNGSQEKIENTAARKMQPKDSVAYETEIVDN